MIPARLLVLSAFILFFALPGPAMAADWNPLPDTGQTKCYDVEGTEITCPADGQPLHGQDGWYHGPTPSYTGQTISGDEVVIDNNTGLVWQQNTADVNNDGSITSGNYPTGDGITWQEAVDYCDGLSFAGSGDWHLPTFTELDSIVDYSQYTPSINETYFQCESTLYWSATTYASSTDEAWFVGFYVGDGSWSYKTDHDYVRCVRGGL